MMHSLYLAHYVILVHIIQLAVLIGHNVCLACLSVRLYH